jgi:hypothetical protein
LAATESVPAPPEHKLLLAGCIVMIGAVIVALADTDTEGSSALVAVTV